MTQFLPENLLAFFAPRPPLPYLPPVDELSINKKKRAIEGLSAYLQQFETKQEPREPPPPIETREEKKAKRRKEKEELLAYKLEQQIALWNPGDNENASSDAYKTLFVARLNYETPESTLQQEFEKYGEIVKIVMPKDRDGKPRGYAFIEYAHKSDMTAAYKKADGIKIDGRRVVVDYERGRTKDNWLPRRLGGGKGETRLPRESKAAIAARMGGDGFEGGYHRGSAGGGGGGGYDRDYRSGSSHHREDYRDRDRDRGRDGGYGNGGRYRSGGGGGGGRDYKDDHRDRYKPYDRNDRNGGGRDRERRHRD